MTCRRSTKRPTITPILCFSLYWRTFGRPSSSIGPLEDLFDLGVAPTSYVDDLHAFAFLPMGIGDDQEETQKPVLKSGLIIPMLLEDGAWRVNLPGWRLAWRQK